MVKVGQPRSRSLDWITVDSLTCAPTLATSIKTGDGNAIEVVGGESRICEEEEIDKELQLHCAGLRKSYGL